MVAIIDPATGTILTQYKNNPDKAAYTTNVLDAALAKKYSTHQFSIFLQDFILRDTVQCWSGCDSNNWLILQVLPVYQLKHGLLSRLPDSTTQTFDTQDDLGVNHAGECV
jgi:hypothetical protein